MIRISTERWDERLTAADEPETLALILPQVLRRYGLEEGSLRSDRTVTLATGTHRRIAPGEHRHSQQSGFGRPNSLCK